MEHVAKMTFPTPFFRYGVNLKTSDNGDFRRDKYWNTVLHRFKPELVKNFREKD